MDRLTQNIATGQAGPRVVGFDWEMVENLI